MNKPYQNALIAAALLGTPGCYKDVNMSTQQVDPAWANTIMHREYGTRDARTVNVDVKEVKRLVLYGSQDVTCAKESLGQPVTIEQIVVQNLKPVQSGPNTWDAGEYVLLHVGKSEIEPGKQVIKYNPLKNGAVQYKHLAQMSTRDWNACTGEEKPANERVISVEGIIQQEELQ